MSAALGLTALVWLGIGLVLAISVPRMVYRPGETRWRYSSRQARRYSYAWRWLVISALTAIAAIWFGTFR